MRSRGAWLIGVMVAMAGRVEAKPLPKGMAVTLKDQAIAAYGPAHAPWFAWRLAVDPELAALKGRPSTKVVLAAKPSGLTWAKLDDVAVNAQGLVAVREWAMFGGPGAPSGSELVIYRRKTSEIVYRQPVMDYSDACSEDPQVGAPCTKAMRARTAEHAQTASLVLSSLGFERQAAVALSQDASGGWVSKDGKTKIAFDDAGDGATVTRGKAVAEVKLSAPVGMAIGVELAGALVLIKQRENGFAACSGDAQRSYSAFVELK